MEHIVSRFRNLTVLGVVLFAQVMGLAVQVYRPAPDGGSARLIRVWTSAAISPIERAVVGAEQGISFAWHNYFYLRGVRAENRSLKAQLEQLQVQQARLREDAAQAHRLQALLAFKEQYVSKTVAAQVIGTSGSDHSRLIFIDKGTDDGLKTDMPVVTPNGIVGKVIRADRTTSQVLLINDEQGGVGAILEKSRLQGIVRGTASGTLILHNIMNDEKVEPGEVVVASGGDRVFPKGMPIGRVKNVRNGADVFFDIEVTPAADLNRLEEVLVITKLAEQGPAIETAGPVRAADVLAERLPSVPPPPPAGPEGKVASPAANSPSGSAAPPAPASVVKPSAKPAVTSPQVHQASTGANYAPPQQKPLVKKPATTTPSDASQNAQPTAPVKNSQSATQPPGAVR